MSFPLPAFGEPVTVEVEFRNHLYAPIYGNAKFTRETFRGVMAGSSDADNDTFRIRCDDTPQFPIRVITKRSVRRINGINVAPIVPLPPKQHTYQQVIVTSSDGKNQYAVRRFEDGHITCTCKGFGYRHGCRHAQPETFENQ